MTPTVLSFGTKIGSEIKMLDPIMRHNKAPLKSIPDSSETL